MKVLVTGSDGYIGCLLGPMLLEQGHDVVGLDTGYYRDGWLYGDPRLHRFPAQLNKDLRRIGSADLDGIDAVVHLAELSNDPLGKHSPENTYKINHQGSIRLATLAKEAGVRRFIYASSCSVYGVGDDDFRTEQSQTNPQTAYGKCKVMVERDVGAMADATFSPTFLRNATAYGASPRMRFDIVLNNLCGLAWTTGQIRMISDGTPWRPLVHVLDIRDAIGCALSAPVEAVHNEIFNVGCNEENYRIKDIAGIVGEVFPSCDVTFGDNGGDNRSYRVSFDKIHGQLPGFKCRRNAEWGARQLRELFERIDMQAGTFEFRAYTRLKQLEYLVRTEQIDEAFFWRAA